MARLMTVATCSRYGGSVFHVKRADDRADVSRSSLRPGHPYARCASFAGRTDHCVGRQDESMVRGRSGRIDPWFSVVCSLGVVHFLSATPRRALRVSCTRGETPFGAANAPVRS